MNTQFSRNTGTNLRPLLRTTFTGSYTNHSTKHVDSKAAGAVLARLTKVLTTRNS